MKAVRFVLALLALSLLAPLQSAKAADVVCYNCPPEWADWASMLKAIKTDLHYDIPHDNKNSGQALAQILAEKSNPVGDIGYFGVTFGMKAKAQDALEPYKPAHWDEVAAGIEGSGRLLDHDSFRHARPVRQQGCAGRQTGAGLLERSAEAGLPRHGGLSRSVVGRGRICRRGGDQSGARRLGQSISIPRSISSRSCGRTIRSFPNRHLMPAWFPARCRSCWIMISTPIAPNIREKGNFEFVIPCEGSVVFPYVVGLVKNAPDKEKAKKVIDYLLSDKGQAIWTNAYLRPARSDRIARGGQGEVPARQRLCPRQGGRLGRDGKRAKRLRRPLSRRGPLMQYGALD